MQKKIVTRTATDSKSSGTHHGTLQVRTNNNVTMKLPAVANPSITRDLLSVHHIAKQWGHVTFHPTYAEIINTRRPKLPRCIGTAEYCNGLYRLNSQQRRNHRIKTSTALAARTIGAKRQASRDSKAMKNKPTVHNSPYTRPANKKRSGFVARPKQRKTPAAHLLHNPSSPPTITTEHDREVHHHHLTFNHADPRTLQRMSRESQLAAIPQTLSKCPPKITCSSCTSGKTRKKPHQPTQHSYAITAAMSSDICGPISPPSRHGNKYIVTLIDTKSRYLIVDFLPNRKAVVERLALILRRIHKLHHKVPQILTTDNAREYLSHAATKVYESFDLEHKTSLPYIPQQNGIAERINATLLNAARCVLHHSKLSAAFWEDAVRDAAFKYNCIRHSQTKQIPYTQWFGIRPNIAKFYIFGQLGSVPYVTDRTKTSKLQDRGRICRYLYPMDEKHIAVYHPETQQHDRVRAVDFTVYHKQRDPVATTTAAFKTYTHHRVPFMITPSTPPPLNRAQARKYPDCAEWAAAHNKELDNLEARNIIRWIPDSDVPKQASRIPLPMTYKYNRDSQGQVVSRKARCSLRGDRMIPYIHYDPDTTTTYTADKDTIRLLLAIAASLNLHLEHLDIEAAYLHEKFAQTGTEPVYVKQFPQFDGTYKHEGSTGQLIGNLYGGLSAGFTYLSKLFKLLKELKFKQSDADPCLFVRINSDGITFLAITIDDFKVAASSLTVLTRFRQELSKVYRVKHLGSPTTFIGWTVRRFRGAIHISQPGPIKSILEKYRMEEANGKDTPYLDGVSVHPPTREDKPATIQQETYRKLLGELRYIADSTRPDIYFLVNRLCTAVNKPTSRHWLAAKRLLRYLRATPQHGIYYPSSKNRHSQAAKDDKSKTKAYYSTGSLTTYSDADFASDPTDRKSISGMVHLYNGAPVSWGSIKQTIHALSTCESEYISATSAAQQTLWLRRLLADMHMLPQKPTPFCIDNLAAIRIAKNTAPTKKRKYIDLRHHFLHAHVSNGNIKPIYIPTEVMLADAFTKPLRRRRYMQLVQAMNIWDRDTARTQSTQTAISPRDGGSVTSGTKLPVAQ